MPSSWLGHLGVILEGNSGLKNKSLGSFDLGIVVQLYIHCNMSHSPVLVFGV